MVHFSSKISVQILDVGVVLPLLVVFITAYGIVSQSFIGTGESDFSEIHTWRLAFDFAFWPIFGQFSPENLSRGN